MNDTAGRTGTAKIATDEVAVLRRRLRLDPKDRLRFAYVTGPGDVVGSHERWARGQADERLPVMAYSTMFYDLVEATGAEGLVCHMAPAAEAPSETPIRFAHTPMPEFSGSAGYFAAKRRHAASVHAALAPFDPHMTVIGGDHHWPALLTWPGKPILSVHNTFWPADRLPGGLKARAARALRRACLAKMRAAVCTSDACADQVALVTKGRVRTFVETPQMRRDEGPMETQKTPGALLYVGRIEESKGVFDLLEAAKALKDTIPGLSLRYLGEGGALEALRERAAGESWIDIAGRVDGDEVMARMAEASLLVCPTRRDFYEGLALVCIEAALAGTPVLASTVVPAAASLGQAAEIYEADDRAALSSAIRRCLTDEGTKERLAEGLRTLDRSVYQDRSRSWGSQLLGAMLTSAA